MKGFLFAFILVSCVTSVFSQGKETGLTQSTPDAVLKGFIKNYGDEKATWTESEGSYEATFKLIGMPATAWYDSTGHRMKVVVDIKEEQLPAIARSYIERNYPKAKVSRARKWTDDQKVSTFEADIKVAADTKKLMFTSKGDLIQ
ncbi:MAG TPA: hypothetical protein VLA46_03510 [Saprospiraceae bacterium]|nr:hypothetical protein [Saprospiraceae bacterium]